jgi:antitoxin component of MazEF toxin-antitoxin module
MDRKISEKNIRKLTRAGKVSLSLTVPRELVVELGWRDNQKVVVKKRGQGILVEDWKEFSKNQS